MASEGEERVGVEQRGQMNVAAACSHTIRLPEEVVFSLLANARRQLYASLYRSSCRRMLISSLIRAFTGVPWGQVEEDKVVECRGEL